MDVGVLRIGDLVCNRRTKFPMRVVGIFSDGTVILDFEENEGDVFEEDSSNLEFVAEDINSFLTDLEEIMTERIKAYKNES